MPIARVGAPPSIAGEDSPEPPDAKALKVEHVEYATDELGYSEEAAQGMTKAELIEQETRANREDMGDELDHQNAEDEEAEEGDSESAGNSSSTSEPKPERSGSPRQATGSSTRSRARAAASPSKEHPQVPQK